MASITKRGKSYLFRVSCGFDGTGKRLMKTRTYTPPPELTPKQTEKEVERQAFIFEEQCRTGQYMDGNIRFSDFAAVWLHDYAEKQLKATTLARYRELLIRINAALGNMKISAIQPHHLMAFYDNLEESGIRQDLKYTPLPALNELIAKRELPKERLAALSGVAAATVHSVMKGNNVRSTSAERLAAALGVNIEDVFAPPEDKGLADTTILHYHRLISVILNTAVHWQMLFSNPCQRVKPPKVKRKEARYLDEQQAAKLLECVQKEPYQYSVIVQLLLYTGMRRGELCGLEWRDVDFSTGCLHIQRSSLYIPEKGVFEDEPKNETSKRVIKLSGSAVILLKDFKKWQERQRGELGTAWNDTGRLFTTWNGKPINPDTITAWFHDFIQRNDLPDCSIHSLRHTNATLLIASGTPIKTVSKRLGHSNVSTTGNIYTHAIQSADEAAAEALEDILSPIKPRSIKVLPKAE